jgi:hypothetical protein
VPAVANAGPEDAGAVARRRLLCGGPDVSAAWRGLGRPIPGMFPPGITANDPLWHDDTIRATLLPLSPPLYEPEIITDHTEQFVASEIIRAAIFNSFRKELPYCCEVRITQFKEPPILNDARASTPNQKVTSVEDLTRISADVIVERESQKRS